MAQGSNITSYKFMAQLLLLALFVGCCSGIKATKLYTFKTNEDFVYLTKFSIGEQRFGHFKFRGGFSSPLEGDERNRKFTMYWVGVDDERWAEFLQAYTCSEKLALAEIRRHVDFYGDGYWSSEDDYQFWNEHRTKIYYIAAINCNRAFHVESPWLPKLWMEFQGYNDASHFAQEERGLLTMNFIMFVLFVFFLGYSAYGYFQEIRLEESWESPLGVLVVALAFEFLQIT